MEALQVIEEILSKVFKWHRFPVSLKAEAVILYFKGLSLRKVKKFLLHKGYEVSIEAIREWFHKVCLCLCIFQEEGTLGQLSWFFTTQRQRDAPLTRDLGM